MTKKFFESWRNKQSLTKHIAVNVSEFEEKGKIYQFYPYHFDLSTLVFGNDYILVKTKCTIYNPLCDGETFKTIKIHRKDIRTVYFNQC